MHHKHYRSIHIAADLGFLNKDISRMFGISPRTVGNILSGEVWGKYYSGTHYFIPVSLCDRAVKMINANPRATRADIVANLPALDKAGRYCVLNCRKARLQCIPNQSYIPDPEPQATWDYFILHSKAKLRMHSHCMHNEE